MHCCRAPGTFARSPSLFISQVRQHTNAGRIEPHFLEGRRSLELVEDRALSRRPGKLDELNTEESSLDRVQAAPFFVHRSAL